MIGIGSYARGNEIATVLVCGQGNGWCTVNINMDGNRRGRSVGIPCPAKNSVGCCMVKTAARICSMCEICTQNKKRTKRYKKYKKSSHNRSIPRAAYLKKHKTTAPDRELFGD